MHMHRNVTLRPALDFCVWLSDMASRSPALPHLSLQQWAGAFEVLSCPSGPSARPARSRQYLRSRSEDRPLSTHWSRCWNESLVPMMLRLRAVLRGKSGAGSASRGLGIAGEPPDAAVTMAVSESLSRATVCAFASAKLTTDR